MLLGSSGSGRATKTNKRHLAYYRTGYCVRSPLNGLAIIRCRHALHRSTSSSPRHTTTPPPCHLPSRIYPPEVNRPSRASYKRRSDRERPRPSSSAYPPSRGRSISNTMERSNGTMSRGGMSMRRLVGRPAGVGRALGELGDDLDRFFSFTVVLFYQTRHHRKLVTFSTRHAG
jgi:hypothetical protein